MAVETNDKKLSELLKWVEEGNAQLPEFQRDWVWDDSKICKLIESITSGYPMGAAMFLANGGENIRFKFRKFVGVSDSVDVEPEYLVLDGQQRLTTLFQVFKCKSPVYTRLDTKRDKTIRRYYYLDIKKCLSQDGDRMDAIISISDKKMRQQANTPTSFCMHMVQKDHPDGEELQPQSVTQSLPQMLTF
jgi:uncharacterized protein with ParB-like and HNH nuclease domain